MNGIQWGPFRLGRLAESRAHLAEDRDKWLHIAAARLDVLDTVKARNSILILEKDRLSNELAAEQAQVALQRKVVDRERAGRLRAEQQRNAANAVCADLRQRLGRMDQPRGEVGRWTSPGKQFTTAAEVLTALRTPTDRGAEMPPAAGDHKPDTCVDCGHQWGIHSRFAGIGCCAADCKCTESNTTTAPADSRPTSERNTA